MRTINANAVRGRSYENFLTRKFIIRKFLYTKISRSTVGRHTLHKIFRAFNFRHLSNRWKFFNRKNFPIYGNYFRRYEKKGLIYCFEKNVLNTSQIFTLYNIISLLLKGCPRTCHTSKYQESEKSQIWLCDLIGPFSHAPSHIQVTYSSLACD